MRTPIALVVLLLAAMPALAAGPGAASQDPSDDPVAVSAAAPGPDAPSSAPPATAAARTATGPPAEDPVLWPERQRAFFQDGPGLLIGPEARAELAALDEAGRDAWITGFLGDDPDPSTNLNELAEGIERRRQLVAAEFPSPTDVRARLLFLNGPPASREVVDCGVAFKPLEVWGWNGRPGGPEAATPGRLVVYRPAPDDPFRLWLPLDSKRVLYTSEMEYWLEQWEELGRRLTARRFDLQVCRDARLIDQVTGVRGLTDYRQDRPHVSDYERFLAPPDDLAGWARAAAATPLPEPPQRLELGGLELFFPERRGQRMLVRARLTLPPGSGAEPVPVERAEGADAGAAPADAADAADAADEPEGDEEAAEEPAEPASETPGAEAAEPAATELRLAVDGVIEEDGEPFETFRVRYRVPDPSEESPVALVLERPLRPERAYLMRLRVTDEGSGGQAIATAGFAVPREAVPVEEPTVAPGTIEALEADLAGATVRGRDSLILVPPETEVVLGLWRAEALVTGERIVKVSFLVDGKTQLTRSRRPFTAELRLSQFPAQQVVRAEGYDVAGELLAADEVVLNQTRGAFGVEIAEPPRGFRGFGTVRVRAEVTVPEERRVERVELRLNDHTIATLTSPPWTAEVEVPVGDEVTYLSAVATLDDGRQAEAVRFLNAPQFLEEVDVRLVELYVSVIDRSNRPVLGLGQDDFEILEEEVPQEITKFELVDNLPLSVGITIDTSGSMVQSLAEAQRAGEDFLRSVMTPRDRCFVIGFAQSPELLMAPTDDAEACLAGLGELRAVGSTSLHDAIVTSLYYFRGMKGQRALVLLSDGDDTSSNIAFPAALEYARRSGVAIYPVGLGVSALGFNVRSKLSQLAEETGGRVFFIGKAAELSGVYDEIEQELRSRYLLAYNAKPPPADAPEEEFREVEVEVGRRGLKARTVRGYYP